MDVSNNCCCSIIADSTLCPEMLHVFWHIDVLTCVIYNWVNAWGEARTTGASHRFPVTMNNRTLSYNSQTFTCDVRCSEL